jgi:antitoxin (DNA-binding transcriptional repressor) of toxin-antitoxin stability system
MPTVTIKQAKYRLNALARRVEMGQTIIVTRDGKPILDLIPHRPKPKGGLNFKALEAFKRKHGIDKIFTYVADDFDAPLPEDLRVER